MKSLSHTKILKFLALILRFFCFEAPAQVTGIVTVNPFVQQINKVEKPSQKSSTTKKPTKSNKKSKKKTSKSTKKTTTKAKKSKKKTSSNPSIANTIDTPPSYVYIDPVRDLGINKGYVCFRIKAYSNIEVSDFSRAVCTYIKNSKKVKLAWTPGSDAVIGYQVYFGTSAKITDKFITDIM